MILYHGDRDENPNNIKAGTGDRDEDEKSKVGWGLVPCQSLLSSLDILKLKSSITWMEICTNPNHFAHDIMNCCFDNQNLFSSICQKQKR